MGQGVSQQEFNALLTQIELMRDKIRELEERLPEVKSSLSESVDPTTGDDIGDGYSVGSLWANASVSPARIFICEDNTTGVAIWQRFGVSPVHTAFGPSAVTSITIVDGSVAAIS